MRVLAATPIKRQPSSGSVPSTPDTVVQIRPSRETELRMTRQERQLARQFEEGDNPAGDIPLEPLFPGTQRKELDERERASDAYFDDDEELVRLSRATLAILRENEAVLERIQKRREVAKNREVDRPEPKTPQKGGPSPAKRMTPGSAQEQEIDAIIGDLIGKLYAQSSVLRSLTAQDAADTIGELFAYTDKSAMLINAYIDAAIEDAALADSMSNVAVTTTTTAATTAKDLAIGCFVPGCVNEAGHRCVACKRVYYCSVACQTADWQAGHAEKCVSK